MRGRWLWVVLTALACRHETTASEAPPAPECGQYDVPTSSGGCMPAGIASDGCAPGFRYVEEERWCEPILPPDMCPTGKVAFLGETECHDVAPCGDGKWGELPTDGSYVYVDGSAAIAGADGTTDRPFPTIAAAIDAASEGQTVAIASGLYMEHLQIKKRVNLRGRCPAMVTLQGDRDYGAIETYMPIEIRRLSIQGPSAGIVGVDDGKGLTIEEVWIHDVRRNGVLSISTNTRSKVTVRRSLIERAQIGAQASSADLTLEDVVLRDFKGTKPLGTGVLGQTDPDYAEQGPGMVVTHGVVVEHASGSAIDLGGSNGKIDGTVVRWVDRAPLGYGIAIYHQSDVAPVSVEVTRSYVIGARGAGINMISAGNVATIVDTTVRDTEISGTGVRANGYGIGCTPGNTLTCTGCVLAGNSVYAVGVVSGTTTLERTIVRDTHPRPDESLGVGVNIGDRDLNDLTSIVPPSVTIRGSVFRRNTAAGIFTFNGTVLVEDTLLADTFADARGEFGDGIFVARWDAMSTGGSVDLRRVVAKNNARGGVVVGTNATLEGVQSSCNAIDIALTGHALVDEANIPPDITDNGGNLCGCGALDHCIAQVSDLAPSSR